MSFSERDVFNDLRNWVDIESVSDNEYQICCEIEKWLHEHGWTVELQPVDEEKKRYNIFAYLGPAEEKTQMEALLNSHMDTVPPYFPSSEDRVNIYGRGTCDAKGQILAQVYAVQSLLDEGLISNSDVALLYVAGEEVDNCGMIASNELGLKPKYLIVGEPTEGQLALGHKGVVELLVKSTGQAAHSGYPELGVSAISPLLRVLLKFDEEKWPIDPRLGPTTLNIGVISGGAASNVIPESAQAKVKIRNTVNAEGIVKRAQEIVDTEKTQVTLDVIKALEAVQCSIVDGFPTDTMKFGTDIPHFKGDHKIYLFGGGTIHVAHSEKEYIGKAQLIQQIHDYKKLILKLVRPESKL